MKKNTSVANKILTNCLSVSDHFMGLAFKRLNIDHFIHKVEKW